MFEGRDPHDVTYGDLLEAWKSDRRAVIENLARRHPAITATFIANAINERVFRTPEQVNEVANMLMDHFMALRDQFGLNATERHLSNATVVW